MTIKEAGVKLLNNIGITGINGDDEVTLDFYRAVRALEDSGNQLLNFYDINCGDKYMPDLIEDIRKYGVKEFTVSESSTALMRIIEALVANGCTISGMVRVNDEYSYGDEPHKTLPALLFKVG